MAAFSMAAENRISLRGVCSSDGNKEVRIVKLADLLFSVSAGVLLRCRKVNSDESHTDLFFSLGCVVLANTGYVHALVERLCSSPVSVSISGVSESMHVLC